MPKKKLFQVKIVQSFGSRRAGQIVTLDANSERDMKALEIWREAGWTQGAKHTAAPVADKSVQSPVATKSEDAPYGLTRAGIPKKRPGRRAK